jgi:hypothetical protein
MYFAVATGPKGKYVVDESEAFEYEGTERPGQVSRNDGGEAHNALVWRLIENGWTSTAQGSFETWYKHMFRRPLTSGGLQNIEEGLKLYAAKDLLTYLRGNGSVKVEVNSSNQIIIRGAKITSETQAKVDSLKAQLVEILRKEQGRRR